MSYRRPSRISSALRLKPDYADAYGNLGIALAQQRRFEEAEAAYQQALRLHPRMARAHNNLGNLLAEQGKLEEAIACYRRAIHLQPGYPDAHSNLGNALRERGETEAAIAALREAIRIRPHYPEAHNNLGIALVKERAFDEAFHHYRTALHMRPDYADAHLNYALARLLVGELGEGWQEYEWRWRCPGFELPDFPQSRWEGESVEGRRILLTLEQGTGDTFQFIRYAQLLKERGATVLVRCSRSLVPILSRVLHIDRVMGDDEPLPEFDIYSPLLSLPRLLKTDLASIPAGGPYLEAEPELIAHWQHELDYIQAFRIGIAWQGNPQYRGDRHRSIPLAHFSPIAAVPGVRLISLQKGLGSEQLRDVRFSITSLGKQVDEARGAFVDTAAALHSLDLVITSDTAIAHLAGAMGIPVWIALPFANDWRWLLGRDDSPWYSSARLFRQSESDDWESVFSRMAEALTEVVTAEEREDTLLIKPADPDQLNSRGVELAQRGRLGEAIALFRQAIALALNPPKRTITLATHCRNQGAFEESIEVLRHAIELNPAYPHAYCNLGVALAQCRKPDEAVPFLQKALELHPEYAHAHNGLGMAQLDRGKHQDAIASFRQAIRCQPEFATVFNNLGNALAETGDLAGATEALRQAVRLQPDYADAYNNLGNVLRDRGELEDSVHCFEQALRSRPNYAEAYNNLGITLGRQGHNDRAIEQYQQALRLNPKYAAAHNNLGIAYAGQQEFAKSMAAYERALQIKPNYPEAHNNLAIVLTQNGRFDQALDHYRSALELKPNYPEAHSNLGIALTESGQTEDALYHYDRAIEMRTDYADAHMNRALTYLVGGDFERGWPEYEWRWRSKEFNARQFEQPRWNGEPLDGRRILLHTEQGFGDTFQFLRYAGLVKQRDGIVVLRCPQPLVHIVNTCPFVDEVCVEGGTLPPFDTHIELMSLPLLFGTRTESVPQNVPYLQPPDDLVAYWRREMDTINAFKIGVVWQGNPKYRGDRHRSMPLANLAPLSAVPGVRLISLQKGFGSEQIQDVRFPITVLGGQVDESRGAFMDTAAILLNLNLVVACDTSLTHLAGALGVPVWLALPFAPDWRWMLGREDSPWYPSVRLFRQHKTADWEPVFNRMAAALAEQVEMQPSHAGLPQVQVAPGELLDKISILQIKCERIDDPAKVRNVRVELDELLKAQQDYSLDSDRLQELTLELKQVNETIWDVEDRIRKCEAGKDFGEQFISLARSVYMMNDRRAALKRAVNELCGSRLIEEKAYVHYEKDV